MCGSAPAAKAATYTRGCDDVGGGDARNFQLVVKGLSAGRYVFDVFARGLGASATQSITVLPASPPLPVPEPAVWITLSSGMVLLSLSTARRGPKTHRLNTAG